MASKKKPIRTAAQKAYDKRRAEAKNKIAEVNAGRKARGAKPIPVVKRVYKRKPKDPRGGHVDAPLPVVANNLVETNGVMEDIGMVFRGDQNKDIPTGTLLQVIEALDMRGLAIDDRFAMLAALRHEGYLASTGKDLFGTPEDLVIGLGSDVLVLNHNNKLVSACDWKDVAGQFNMISRPIIHVHATIGFTYPTRITPDIIEIDGVPYQPVF